VGVVQRDCERKVRGVGGGGRGGGLGGLWHRANSLLAALMKCSRACGT
jgi:hypothetical protein